ncbi:Uncharacterised protein [Salmonella enterica subsp. arizonae]|uniref:Uncharacterized protein n=1 Tax=Salmonella enterica subsp. arizonae TaxID=59203 RepID=A0A2X4TIR3_SALER|nr:Uncharacterised protein [Salmonella enterica subsp. arizonae]
MLALHDTKEYDLANALNLGIMADLVYAAEVKNPTIDYFFRQKCQDLSCLPQLVEYPNYFHMLAVDVPFRERYQPPLYMNTGEGRWEKVIPACLRWSVPRTFWFPGAVPTVC